jgi:hypothetical protein
MTTLVRRSTAGDRPRPPDTADAGESNGSFRIDLRLVFMAGESKLRLAVRVLRSLMSDRVGIWGRFD